MRVTRHHRDRRRASPPGASDDRGPRRGPADRARDRRDLGHRARPGGGAGGRRPDGGHRRPRCRAEARRRGGAIAAASGNERVELFTGDLSDLVVGPPPGGETVAEAHPAIDVLVHCAAVYTPRRRVTADGLETMFATNVAGPFLLTNLLLDQLRAGRARILVLSAPSTVRLDFDDLQAERRFRSLTAFGATKAADLLFTFELARRLEGSGVTANAVHPGLVRTKLMRDAPAPLRWATWLVSAQPGARGGGDRSASPCRPITRAEPAASTRPAARSRPRRTPAIPRSPADSGTSRRPSRGSSQGATLMKIGLQIYSFTWPGGPSAIGPNAGSRGPHRRRRRLRLDLGHGPLLADRRPRLGARADARGLDDARLHGRPLPAGTAGPDGRWRPLPEPGTLASPEVPQWLFLRV